MLLMKSKEKIYSISSSSDFEILSSWTKDKSSRISSKCCSETLIKFSFS